MGLLSHALERRNRPSRTDRSADSQSRCPSSRDKERAGRLPAGRGSETARNKVSIGTRQSIPVSVSSSGSPSLSLLPVDICGSLSTVVGGPSRSQARTEDSLKSYAANSKDGPVEPPALATEVRYVSASERRQALLEATSLEQHELQEVAQAARKRLDERLRLGTSRELRAAPVYLREESLHRMPRSNQREPVVDTATSNGRQAGRGLKQRGVIGRHSSRRHREEAHGNGTGGAAVKLEEDLVLEVWYGGSSGGEERQEFDVASSPPECSICLDPFATGDVCVRLVCHHRFHEECVKPWLRKCKHCPYCRATA